MTLALLALGVVLWAITAIVVGAGGKASTVFKVVLGMVALDFVVVFYKELTMFSLSSLLILVFVVLLVLLVVAWKKGKLDKWIKPKAAEPDPAKVAVFYPGTYQCPIAPPPESVRKANAARQLAEGGPMGGGVDGGIYLEGGMGLHADANGVIDGGDIILFEARCTVEGRINANGYFEGVYKIGGQVAGPIKFTLGADGSVSGVVAEGGGRDWVFGDITGGPGAFKLNGML